MGDRISEAIVPYYDAIGTAARTVPVNSMDETAWFLHSDRHGLWVMATPEVAYFQVPLNCSKAAFAHLSADWTGILVRDGPLVSRHGPGGRQRDLAPLLRTAQGLAERVEAAMVRCGRRVHTELQRWCHRGTERLTVGQWRAWYARFRSLITKHAARADKAGTFARRLAREEESLWVFLDVQGVEATNNLAEVRSPMRRIMAATQPGDMQREGQSLGGAYPVTPSHLSHPRASDVSTAGRCGVLSVHRREAYLSWLTQHESLPVPSTP